MATRLAHSTRALPQRQRGAVIVLIVIAMLSMLLMAALALDGSHMLVNKTRLQNAVDAAALSGAKTLHQVMGTLNASTLSRDAALQTLNLNAAATGNAELATAIAGNVAGFAVVELSASVYGPFSFPGPSDARYVRVSVPDYPLAGFFWNVVQVFGDGTTPDKSVAAVATAGPSPTSPCDLAPVMVCGESVPNTFFGYSFGDLEVLKSASNNSSGIGPGNFQLLDFGSGGSTVRELMAGGGTICPLVGDDVQTKPGNTVGPSIQGLNTRFGEYSGGMSGSEYPPDLVTNYTQVGNQGALSLSDSGSIVYGKSNGKSGDTEAVSADADGNITTASGVAVFDYNDWQQRSAECISGSGSGCQSNGVFQRRILRVVVGQCTGTDGGTAQVPVLGFGCFFVLQPASQKGNESQIFGQFVEECEGDNVPGPDPASDQGPQIIQLYKSYIDNNRTPSSDS
ncbi:Tad domain-containing protein [Pseudomonas sp. PDM15]|uniref:TadE/TadG family type IV pilus assembly protein n=1 Tax=Pseudomonas sp. PDM15 TaxID=2769303 RepID=UPI00177E21A1|nr:TadE/TadG family type IV pilus assembly protein [Pseudomonas sp. PDM15]MBD9425745.1 Tad domain-containing protein [Pseudomonas sp. PDM15]